MIGDSLGAELEFKSLAEIRRLFPNGVDRILPAYGVRGAITDDSQMTLFTLEGLLESRGQGMDERIAAVHRALLRWLETQDRRATVEGGHRGLIQNPTLRHRRAPGNTCLSALQEATRPGEPARNDSKGCGTIMRVAPVAFLAEPAEIRELAMRTSALTHGHPTGGWAAAFWAELIRRICDHPEGRGAFDLIVQDLSAEYGSIPGAEEVAIAVRRAMSYDTCQPEDMEGLGGGWTAETALAIALRACRCARSLEHGLKLAVMHGGDSDSTGAIAGNLLGVMFSDEVFRHPWHAEVEGTEILDGLLPPSRI
ncbi:ADP-ribosylglycohydrolase family protein [Cereibacter sphaeroides]|uniref:ADP-ribosylglycohydrolase family protein n=1 Tax=Cereibacter sphaeroides TaxID=1063 RepID=UPI001F3F75F4|nr:ADP-ribosylglycohydrolase family protein [Cereibacter sphaeroides]MCE6949932.1 ADP-ribosylglycohydrolase family protein [Cereibacter sphaeroides]